MKSAYPKIFEPITIKRTTIKNRIAMTPMIVLLISPRD